MRWKPKPHLGLTADTRQNENRRIGESLPPAGREDAPRSLPLLDAVASAFNRRDWDRLRTLYHDDALLVTVIAHGNVVGPDELMDIFRDLEQTAYLIGREQRVVAIDDHAVIVVAPLRYEPSAGGIAHSSRAWLLTFKDELVYRSRDFHDEQEARDAYALHGIDLGVTTTD